VNDPGTVEEQLAEHRRWLESDWNEGTRLVLEGLSIPRFEITDPWLDRAVLKDVDLTRAVLPRARFRSGELARVKLTGANLANATLLNAELEDVDLADANLTAANLYAAYLLRCSLMRANLDEADLGKAEFHSVDLREATLRRATLVRFAAYRTSFVGSDLSGAVLSGAILANNDLRHLDLSGATVTSTSFDGASIFGLRGPVSDARDVRCEWVDTSEEGDGSRREGADALWRALGI
jgi:uncharacterized protein YjbI with pentapeptide repeats